jgi:hypothetical protein
MALLIAFALAFPAAMVSSPAFAQRGERCKAFAQDNKCKPRFDKRTASCVCVSKWGPNGPGGKNRGF